jgi:Flp pilus assembly protein TadB
MIGPRLARGMAVVGSVYPGEVEAEEDLVRALAFLGADVEPDLVERASRTCAVAAGGSGVLSVLLVPGGLGLWLAFVSVSVGLLLSYAVVAGPVLLARARRTSALGDAPDLIARAVVRMRLSPSPEAAAAFAAGVDEGPLAASLRTHLHRARPGAGTGLTSFAEEWADWFPALRRSVSLVEAAGAAAESDRERLLDRALETILEGTESAMRSFASDIRGPAMGLYAFGVLLPTALISLLPAASMAGLPVTPLAIGVLYDLLLPLGLLAGSAWLLSRRPVAFRPPDLGGSGAAEAGDRRLAVGAGLVVGLLAWIGTATAYPRWAGPIAALGYGFGTALVIRYYPVLDVYERLTAVEDGLSDALSLVGRRVAAGQAAEAAVAETARELDGEAGAVLGDAARHQRLLGSGLEEAFLGRFGATTGLPSPRLRRSAGLFARAAEEGAPAGEAILALGSHLAALETVEERAQHELDAVCSTLRSTASLFGPFVAGATVALADGMAGEAAVAPGGDPLPWLGLVVGGYALLMACILTALSIGLKRGLDGPLVAYHTGRALILATTTLLVSYALAGIVA